MKTQTLDRLFKLLVLVLAVILLLDYFGCVKNPFRKPKIVEKIVPVKELVQNVKTDSIASQKVQDSINLIIKTLENSANKWFAAWNNEVNETASLQIQINDLFHEAIPDTCEPFRKKVLEQYNKLVVSSAKKDTACLKSNNALRGIINQKDALITNGKKDYSKLKANFDTAIANQKALTKMLPKRAILLGANIIGNQGNFVYGYGINLSYKTKNDKIFEIGAMQIKSTTQFTLGIKVPLFKF